MEHRIWGIGGLHHDNSEAIFGMDFLTSVKARATAVGAPTTEAAQFCQTIEDEAQFQHNMYYHRTEAYGETMIISVEEYEADLEANMHKTDHMFFILNRRGAGN